MQNLSRPCYGAVLFIAGSIVAVIVMEFPWFAFLATMLGWTAMRAPESIGLGGMLKIEPAASVSDAAYEGLWAAVGLVFGVSLSVEFLKAFA